MYYPVTARQGADLRQRSGPRNLPCKGRWSGWSEGWDRPLRVTRYPGAPEPQTTHSGPCRAYGARFAVWASPRAKGRDLTSYPGNLVKTA